MSSDGRREACLADPAPDAGRACGVDTILQSYVERGRQLTSALLLDSNADVALLQEAREPPADVAAKVHVDPGPWRTGPSRGWRAAIVKLSNTPPQS
jgi:hypothetical protein